jgi:hypothetical protein
VTRRIRGNFGLDDLYLIDKALNEVITIEITATFWLGGYDLYKKLSS